MFNRRKLGQVTIEVSSLMPEKLLNVLWDNEIYTSNIVKVDIVTIKFTIFINDFKEVERLIKKYKGKLRIVNTSGIIVLITKKKKSIVSNWCPYIFYIYIFFSQLYMVYRHTNAKKFISF